MPLNKVTLLMGGFAALLCYFIVKYIYKRINESFEDCANYTNWQSCHRSANNHCEWNGDKQECRRKCNSYSTKSCPSNRCRLFNRHCISGGKELFSRQHVDINCAPGDCDASNCVKNGDDCHKKCELYSVADCPLKQCTIRDNNCVQSSL